MTLDLAQTPKPAGWRLLLVLSAAVVAVRSPAAATGIAAAGTLWNITSARVPIERYRCRARRAAPGSHIGVTKQIGERGTRPNEI